MIGISDINEFYLFVRFQVEWNSIKTDIDKKWKPPSILHDSGGWRKQR